MFTIKKLDTTELECAIYRVHELMDAVATDPEKYGKYVDQLAKLYAIQDATRRQSSISPDTLATIAANLFGILVIVGHERANVITTKALGFVGKLR